jgi:hypothetical protein
MKTKSFGFVVRIICLSLILVIVFAFPFPVGADEVREKISLFTIQSFKLIDPPSGYTYVFGMGINKYGVISGYAGTVEPDSHFYSDAITYNIHTQEFTNHGKGTTPVIPHAARALDVNKGGLVVGSTFDLITHESHPKFATKNGQFSGLPLPPPYFKGLARSVNDAGFIVGYGDGGLFPYVRRATIWNKDGKIHEIIKDPENDIPVSEATVINNTGLIAGLRTRYPENWTPYLYDMHTHEYFYGEEFLHLCCGNTIIEDMNEQGTIVGRVFNGIDGRAFVKKIGKPIEIIPIPVPLNMRARRIADNGDILILGINMITGDRELYYKPSNINEFFQFTDLLDQHVPGWNDYFLEDITSDDKTTYITGWVSKVSEARTFVIELTKN